MIEFKSINIDGKVREWKFNDKHEIINKWRSSNPDLPANDDPVFDITVDGEEIYLGGVNNPCRHDDDAVWFEDLLTYFGVDIG